MRRQPALASSHHALAWRRVEASVGRMRHTALACALNGWLEHLLAFLAEVPPPHAAHPYVHTVRVAAYMVLMGVLSR